MKSLKIILLAGLVSAILFAFNSTVFAAWVPSPETWTNHPDKWAMNNNGGTTEIDATVHYGTTGTRSIKMTGSASADTYVILDKPWTLLDTATNYTFTVWHKTNGGYSGTHRLDITYLTRWGQPNPAVLADAQKTVQDSSGEHIGWVQISGTFSVPAFTSRVLINLVAEGTSTDIVWFDDVNVYANNNSSVNLVKNPSFETLHTYMSDSTFFSKLNLDYPGLSTVKTDVSNSDYVSAKADFLSYYMARTEPLQLGGRNGPRPTPDPNYETYLADLVKNNHTLSQRDGNRYNMGADIDWSAYPPDGSNSTLAIRHYISAVAPSTTTKLLLYLDKGTGSVAGDNSGFANHGTIIDTPVWTTGKYDGGLTVNSNTYVTIPDSSNLDITDKLTVTGWFKPNGTATNAYGIQKGSAYGLKVADSNGHPVAQVYVDGAWREATSSETLTDGTWYNLSMTYSASSRELKLYVNGVLKQTTVLSGLNSYNINISTSPLNIGRDSLGLNNIFTGDADLITVANVTADSISTNGPGFDPGRLVDAYWNTGNEAYAEETIDWILDWIRDNHYRESEYSSDPDYTVETVRSAVNEPAWGVLQEGFRMQYIIWILNSIRDSDSLTPDKFTAIMKSLYEHAEDLRTRHDTGTNGAISEMMCFYQFATFFPEFIDSTDWKSYAVTSLNDVMKLLVYNDGSEIELSTMYQISTIGSGFLIPYQIEALNGWSNFPAEYGKQLEKMYEYLMYSSKPDRSLPAINDSMVLFERDILMEGGNTFSRDDMKYVATDGNQGTAPTYKSFGFPYAGQYIMRSTWNADALYFGMDAGPLGVSHYHEDKLSFDLSAYGKNFIVDPGIYTYDSDRWTSYFASTTSHNTVVVDDLGQNRDGAGPKSVTAPLTDTTWSSNDSFDYASGVYNVGYGPALNTSANQKRIVFFAKPDYWIVRDIITGTGTHTVEDKFQFRPMSVTLNSTTKIAQTNNTNEANLRIIPLDSSTLGDSTMVEGQDASGPTSAYTNDSNTILLLNLNEGSGSTCTDLSSHSNDGTVTGTPSWTTGGKFSGALLLNNGSASYINVPYDSSLDITNDITAEAWVYWNGTSAGYIINKRNSFGIFIDINGIPEAVLWTGPNYTIHVAPAYQAIKANEWTHVSMTYSSTTKQLRVYVNGSLARLIVLTGLSDYTISTSSYDLKIGTDYYDNNFVGRVDDVRISNSIREYQGIGGWSNMRYGEKFAAPQIIYKKSSVTLPTNLDFVFYPTSAGQNPIITTSRLNVTIGGNSVSTSQASAIKLEKPDGTDYVILSEPDLGDKSFDNYLSDSEMAFIRTNTSGNITSMSIMKGKKLNNTSSSLELIKVLSSGIADQLTAIYSGSTLELDTSLDLPNTECVRIYAPSTSTVEVNGQSVAFQMDGNYVIVGSNACDVDANTVLLMHFNEDSGTTVSDSSSSANNGVLQGSPVWTSSKFGNALYTNGGTGYITVSNSSSLDITDDITVEGWFKGAGTTVTGYGIQKGLAYGLTVLNDGRPCGLVYVAGDFRTVIWNNSLTPGVWYHLAITYSSTSKTINLYVNGLLKVSNTLSGLSTYKIGTDINNIAIGRDSMGWGGENIFNGYIDEVRISNTLRSSYLLNKPYTSDANTVLLLHLDEVSGTTATDSSSYANNGTLQGTPIRSSSKFSNAISTNGGNGYVIINNSSSLNITDNITLEGWFKGTGTTFTGYGIQKGYAYGLTALNDGRPCGLVYVDGDFRTVIWNSSLTPGEWYHLAMNYSSTSKTIKLYVNGVEKASTSLSGLSTYQIGTDSNWLAIGRDSMGWGGENIFSGYIDDVRISNIVRNSFPYASGN